MTRSRQRDEKKGEQGGSKEGKLGRQDETETERKGRVDVGEKWGVEGSRFRNPKLWVRNSVLSCILLKGGNPAEWLQLFLYFSCSPMTSYTTPSHTQAPPVILKLPALIGQKHPSPQRIPHWQPPLCAVPGFCFCVSGLVCFDGRG